MKKLLLICCFFAGLFARAQNVRTMVTEGPVIVGESFQVQYVLEEMEGMEINSPVFRGFKKISGPNIYEGYTYGADGPMQLRNLVYTLEAISPGTQTIPGISVKYGGKKFRSADARVEIISVGDAISRGLHKPRPVYNDAYILKPGEDPYKKIRDNLYMRVHVSRKSCFVGEPIIATYKLYSSLDSRSDIVKNPGFYGFTVEDMVGLNENLTTTEIINGKKFDVHTIRRVQMYPLRSGTYQVDAMDVQSKTRFLKSDVRDRAEQRVIEGVISDDEWDRFGGSNTYDSRMSTEPVNITVKPLPVKNQPDDFTGGTGSYDILASVVTDTLARNEKGELIITISGKGNFTQLTPPAISWPTGIEGFQPEVQDLLDHEQAPLSGVRTFRYRFISSKPGTYTLPSVHFSFFNLDTQSYKTVATQPIDVVITNKSKTGGLFASKRDDGTASGFPWLPVSLGAILITAALVILTWWRRKKKIAADVTEVPVPGKPTIDELLSPAALLKDADNKSFCAALRGGIWNYFREHHGLNPAHFNKRDLRALLAARNVNTDTQKGIMQLLDHCDGGMYTDATSSDDRQQLLDEARRTLNEIKY